MFEEDVRKAFYGNLLFSKNICHKLEWFRKKYTGFVFHGFKSTLRVQDDLVKIGDVLFNSLEILEREKVLMEVYRIIGKRSGDFRELKKLSREFIEYLDDLRTFYELNKYSKIRDQRVDVISDLRRRTLLLIRYMRFRSKPIADSIPHKAIERLFANDEDYSF